MRSSHKKDRAEQRASEAPSPIHSPPPSLRIHPSIRRPMPLPHMALRRAVRARDLKVQLQLALRVALREQQHRRAEGLGLLVRERQQPTELPDVLGHLLPDLEQLPELVRAGEREELLAACRTRVALRRWGVVRRGKCRMERQTRRAGDGGVAWALRGDGGTDGEMGGTDVYAPLG